jgi:hypothetical protein
MAASSRDRAKNLRILELYDNSCADNVLCIAEVSDLSKVSKIPNLVAADGKTTALENSISKTE